MKDANISIIILVFFFSCRLNPALPDLTDDDGNPVNFRRALLNKCQEEFDYGVNAMKAVAEREKRAQTQKVSIVKGINQFNR